MVQTQSMLPLRQPVAKVRFLASLGMTSLHDVMLSVSEASRRSKQRAGDFYHGLLGMSATAARLVNDGSGPDFLVEYGWTDNAFASARTMACARLDAT